MILKAEQQRLKSLLLETIVLLCKNGLNFDNEICIEGLIGITLDQEDIFLVNIKESIVPAEEVEIEQVSRDVKHVSKEPANNADVQTQHVIHELKPHSSFCNVISTSIDTNIVEDTSVTDESTAATESALSQTHVVISVEENYKTRPVSARHEVDDDDDVIQSSECDISSVRKHLPSHVDLSSDTPHDRVCFSPQPKKRRRATTLERPHTFTPVTSVNEMSSRTASVSDNNSTGYQDNVCSRVSVSDNSTGRRDNLSRGGGRRAENIKLEKVSEFIEIKDEEISGREEDTLEEGNVRYNQYDGVREGVTEGDVYMGEDGSMVGGGLGELGGVLPWQSLSRPQANGGSRSRQEVDIGYFPEEPLTSCSYCGEQYSDMSDAYTHQCFTRNTFTRTKLAQGFKHRTNMLKHSRVMHTGERSFQCEQCNKPFSTLFNLQRHELIHTGERPFECDVCNKRFTQLSTLRTHERIHWRESVRTYQQLETF